MPWAGTESREGPGPRRGPPPPFGGEPLVALFHLQAQSWCDGGAYLLANQLVEKLQSKEAAQAALQDIEKFLEEAPSMLSSGADVLAMEYEGVLTPQLQVGHHGYLSITRIKGISSWAVGLISFDTPVSPLLG